MKFELKRTHILEAIQWTGENLEEVSGFLGAILGKMPKTDITHDKDLLITSNFHQFAIRKGYYITEYMDVYTLEKFESLYKPVTI